MNTGCFTGKESQLVYPSQVGVLQNTTSNTIVRPNIQLFIPFVESDTATDRCIGIKLMLTKILGPQVSKDLYVNLKDMTAFRAINFLCYTFDTVDEPVKLNGTYTTLQELSQTFPGIKFIRACDVGPIIFYGGPPNKEKWYHGSLLSFLVDKILSTGSKGNHAVIGKFLNLEL